MHAQGDAFVQFGQYLDTYGEREYWILSQRCLYFFQLGEVKHFMLLSHWK